MRILAVVIALLLAGPALAQKAPGTNKSLLEASATAAPGGMEILFAPQAERLRFDGTYLTLEGVAPMVPFFVDRPLRIAGAVSTTQFTEIWALSEKSLKIGPPIASVALISDSRDPSPIVELHSVSLSEGTAVFEAKLVSGDLPEAAGPVTLMFQPRVWWPRPRNGMATRPAPGTPDIACFVTHTMGQSMCHGVEPPATPGISAPRP